MNGDRPSDQLTYAHQCQSTHINPIPQPEKIEDDKSDKEGTNRTRVLTGYGREQTVIIFRDFTQELVECEDEGVPRIHGTRKDGRGEKLE